MSGQTIEKATLPDVQEIWKLGTGVSGFKTGDGVVDFWPIDILSNMVGERPDVSVFVLRNPGIIGFLIINFNNSLKKAEVENIFIAPEHRGDLLQIRALMDAGIAECKQKGIKLLTYLAGQDKLAALFARFGFSRGYDFHWMNLVLDDEYKNFANPREN
jgi:GNAT superfamily N-acetyltransferase